MHNVFHFQSDLYAVTFTLNLISHFNRGYLFNIWGWQMERCNNMSG